MVITTEIRQWAILSQASLVEEGASTVRELGDIIVSFLLRVSQGPPERVSTGGVAVLQHEASISNVDSIDPGSKCPGERGTTVRPS